MAHRQTYLAGPNPTQILEEAYYSIMSTLSEIDDFIFTRSAAGFITRDQQFQAEDLHRTLTDQNVRLNLTWRAEVNTDKYCNTREWVQIIAEETLMKLAAIKTVVSLPGSFPRDDQTETHGHRTSPFPGSFLRQSQTETSKTQFSDDWTINTVWRTTVHNGHVHKNTCPQYTPRIERAHNSNDDCTVRTNIGQTLYQTLRKAII